MTVRAAAGTGVSQGERWIMASYSTWKRPHGINGAIKLTQSVDIVKKVWQPCASRLTVKIFNFRISLGSGKGRSKLLSMHPSFASPSRLHYAVAFLSIFST